MEKKDPIKRFRIYLRKRAYGARVTRRNSLKKLQRKWKKAVEEAEAYNPVIENMFNYFMLKLQPGLKRQMDELPNLYGKKEGGLKCYNSIWSRHSPRAS